MEGHPDFLEGFRALYVQSNFRPSNLHLLPSAAASLSRPRSPLRASAASWSGISLCRSIGPSVANNYFSQWPANELDPNVCLFIFVRVIATTIKQKWTRTGRCNRERTKTKQTKRTGPRTATPRLTFRARPRPRPAPRRVDAPGVANDPQLGPGRRWKPAGVVILLPLLPIFALDGGGRARRRRRWDLDTAEINEREDRRFFSR